MRQQHDVRVAHPHRALACVGADDRLVDEAENRVAHATVGSTRFGGSLGPLRRAEEFDLAELVELDVAFQQAEFLDIPRGVLVGGQSVPLDECQGAAGRRQPSPLGPRFEAVGPEQEVVGLGLLLADVVVGVLCDDRLTQHMPIDGAEHLGDLHQVILVALGAFERRADRLAHA